MKILAMSDLHVDVSDRAREAFFVLLHRAKSENPDIVVVAGDTATGMNVSGVLEWAYGEMRKTFKSPILVTAGNHELWDISGDCHVDSITWLESVFPMICGKVGIHCLDDEPYIEGDVGFVGTVGWYDYSLGDPGIPIEIYKRKHYQGVQWCDNLSFTSGMDDRKFADRMEDRLIAQIKKIRSKVDKIVAVTHMIPFAKLQVPGNRFVDGYGGTPKLGDILLSEPKVCLSICGHRHVGNRAKIHHIDAVMLDSDYEWPKYSILEL